MDTIQKWIEDQVMARIFGFFTSAEGQQRIRVAFAGIVLSVAAKWGLPPAVADYAGQLIALGAAALVTAWTVRKPAAPSTPALPPLSNAPEDPAGLPGEPPTIVS